mmetsp:Transcript_30138/g.76154  ORF Transcript_30138/g.76154 Transcript_30138/m.76154 type:complete len:679 (-) Transcript_30138:137-2173(-)
MPALLANAAPRDKDEAPHAFECAYPMHVISVVDLLKMPKMVPHQELKSRGVLKEYTSDIFGKVIGVSHQWLGYSAPDPEGVHLHTLQEVLRRLMAGEWSTVEFYWLYAVMFKATSMKANWKASLPEMYVWLDYFSMPQVLTGADKACMQAAAQAVQSIPSYMERCALLMVVAPPCKHNDTGLVCNYATWRGRGWCRTELLACSLAPRQIPLMVCTGVNATPFLIHTCDGPRLSVGDGVFSCCTLGHELNGRRLDCDKVKVHAVLRTMLRAKVQLLRLQGNRDDQHFWASLQDTLLRGLPGVLNQRPPCMDPKLAKVLADQQKREQRAGVHSSPAEALSLRLGWDEQDEAAASRSGFTLLMCAALSDNAAAAHQLTSGPDAIDPNIKLTNDYSHLAYMHKGVRPLMVATAFASPDTVSALIEARADPYAVNARGVCSLMTAACKGSHEVIQFWLQRFPKWDLERTEQGIGISVSAITALSGVRKAPIINTLLEARAELKKRNTWGREGLLLALIATNEDSDEDALKLLLDHGCDPNLPWRSHDMKWRAMLKGVNFVQRCSRSRVVMELGLIEGATPLHFAAKRGDVKFVKLLMQARATPQANSAGHTPLDVARRFFGDHVPKLLEDALLTSAGVGSADPKARGAALAEVHPAVPDAGIHPGAAEPTAPTVEVIGAGADE